MSAYTHQAQLNKNVAVVPPAPSEAHQKSDRTWEQAIKFDSGLTIGAHCVVLENKGNRRGALVEITSTGAVYLLVKPEAGDMYSSWSKVEGDQLKQAPKGRNGVIVWAARDPAHLERFENPTAIVRKVVIN